MKAAAEQQRAEFVMAPLTWHNPGHHDILARLAAEHGIGMLDTRGVLEAGGPGFLPGDGHFTGEGARAIAVAVAGFLGRANRR